MHLVSSRIRVIAVVVKVTLIWTGTGWQALCDGRSDKSDEQESRRDSAAEPPSK